MQTGKARTCQQEYTAVRISLALTFINRLRIHECIGVEVLLRRTECRGAAKLLPVFKVGTVGNIRFAGIHPPGIDTQGIQVFVHLLPEEFAGICAVGIVEGTDIARSYPVAYAVADGLTVHPAVFVEFLEVLGVGIEFRPDRNHHVCIQGMYAVNHRLWVGEPFGIELVAAPLVLSPVEPVQHDVVDGNLSAAELAEGTQQLLLCLVSLAALPETHRPFGHHGCLACQGSVTADYLVHCLAGHKVVVHLVLHLAPPRHLPGLFLRYGIHGS